MWRTGDLKAVQGRWATPMWVESRRLPCCDSVASVGSPVGRMWVEVTLTDVQAFLSPKFPGCVQL